MDIFDDCFDILINPNIDELTIQADFHDQKWTQLLLPVYTTAYRDDNGEVQPILINGQNGTIYGVKKASLRQARNWSLCLLGISAFCFLFGLLFAAGIFGFP